MTNGRPSETPRTMRELGRPAIAASSENHVAEIIYKDEIPAFVGATLERLYACVYCTLTRIAAYDSLERISTYVRKDGCTITAVILFRIDHHIVYVLNQQISLPAEKILTFCETIFRTFKSAQVIRFYGLDASLERSSLPCQQLQSIEENIIHLPPSKEAYLSSLRPQFAKQIRVGAAKIAEDHPSFRLRMVDRGAIEEHQVTQILALAKQRMDAKGCAAYSEKVDRVALLSTLQRYGHLVMATIDDRICAGSISFSVGRKHFHAFIAHDPDYDQYMLGNQMWLAAILYAIELRAEECWLMGGARAHKARFRAKPYTFNSITLYRSRMHALRHGRLFAEQLLRLKKIALKAACKEQLEKKTLLGRLIEKSIIARNALQAKKTEI
ncbi:hypothetical protein GCM10027321_45430 [Massilia terrae]|uniref:GNAT family N-acetyltransferase n=1 Tax=Massilia terrae TaxID=1811224 RepID=A0ABT2CYG2_9BURK|nr:GNAT family N-acetyltransferase [Massilia terrae]MCS0659008.1 GNAT family N-acetyltransferase [Massilia terrae]